ncbi:MAG: hypothetical protein ACRC6E_11585 [Fusobacteriaceae bacterium]
MSRVVLGWGSGAGNIFWVVVVGKSSTTVLNFDAKTKKIKKVFWGYLPKMLFYLFLTKKVKNKVGKLFKNINKNYLK